MYAVVMSLHTVWDRANILTSVQDFLVFKQPIKKMQINSKILCPQSPSILVTRPRRLRDEKRAMGTRMLIWYHDFLLPSLTSAKKKNVIHSYPFYDFLKSIFTMSGLLAAGKRLYYPPYLRTVKSKNFGKKNKTLLSNPAQPSPPKNCVWEAAGNAGTKMAVKSKACFWFGKSSFIFNGFAK